MFRSAPLQSAIVTLVPLVVAGGQLANSALTTLSFGISIPFALVMVGFAAVLTQYNLARYRRRELERDVFLTA